MDILHFGDACGFDRKLDLVIWPRLQTMDLLHFGDACGFAFWGCLWFRP